jgi:hypothetical protein
MMNGVLLPVIIENITTRKDNTIKITLGSQEVSPQVAGELFRLLNKLAACYFSPKETISQTELNQVDAIDVEMGGKSQSQRLRGVLFKLWEQSPEGYKTFDTFYHAKTDQIIDHYKNKLNP